MNFSRMIRLIDRTNKIEQCLCEKFDPNNFLKNIESMVMMAGERGGTDPEREMAKLAIQRLVLRANTEAPNLPPIERMDFLAKMNQLIGSTLAPPVQKPKPNAVQSDDLAVPQAPDEEMTYAVPGTGLTAQLKKVRWESVKYGRQDIAYFVLRMTITGRDTDDLDRQVANMDGWERSPRGDDYWSPAHDRFKVNHYRGYAATEPYMGPYDEIQKKLKACGFRHEHGPMIG